MEIEEDEYDDVEEDINNNSVTLEQQPSEQDDSFLKFARNIMKYGHFLTEENVSSISNEGDDSAKRASDNLITRKGFLYCYRLYKKPEELLEMWSSLFLEHYSTLLKQEAVRKLDTPKTRRRKVGKEEEVTILRVQCNDIIEFLREWMSDYLSSDFNKTMRESLLNLLKRVIDSQLKMTLELMIIQSMSTNKKRSKKNRRRPIVRLGMNGGGSINQEMDQIDILEHSTLAIAKALTVHEFDLFKQIHPNEFLNQNWQKDDKQKLSPNITRFISRFNEVSFWVASEIVVARDRKRQRSLVMKFIKIAKQCEMLNNFNSAMEILSGLNNAAVQRLEYIWKGLPDKHSQLFRELEIIMDPQSNFRTYRNLIKERPLPSLPYFGIFLRDVTFTNVGNEPYLEDGKMINYKMIQLIHNTIQDVKKFQSVNYQLNADDSILHLLTNQKDGLRALDDDTLYRLSNQVYSNRRQSTASDIADESESAESSRSESWFDVPSVSKDQQQQQQQQQQQFGKSYRSSAIIKASFFDRWRNQRKPSEQSSDRKSVV